MKRGRRDNQDSRSVDAAMHPGKRGTLAYAGAVYSRNPSAFALAQRLRWFNGGDWFSHLLKEPDASEKNTSDVMQALLQFVTDATHRPQSLHDLAHAMEWLKDADGPADPVLWWANQYQLMDDGSLNTFESFAQWMCDHDQDADDRTLRRTADKIGLRFKPAKRGPKPS